MIDTALKCPTCRAAIETDSRFCRHCGATLPMPMGAGGHAGGAPAAPGLASRAAAKAPDVHRDPTAEREIWSGRPAWRSSCGLWALWFCGSVIALWASRHYAENMLLGALPAGGVAIALLVREALIVWGSRYRLTTQRLFIDRGILSRVTDQMELVRVDDVRVRQGLVDRVLDTGEVEVHSSDASHESVKLVGITDPHGVAEEIRLHLRGVQSKGTVFMEAV